MGSPRRRSVTGEDLPNARIVSNNVFQYLGWDMTPVSAVFSTYLTHHGQFIDHDVIATPLPKDEKGEDILDCCNKTRNYPEHCFNIEISKEDPFYRGKTCMNFVRHFGGPSLNCAAGRNLFIIRKILKKKNKNTS
ncbi:peroxidase-like protein [Saccostrea cucullata]|uniref:peroxidase-like protein n=1 Tax=Saccostrea cuccullata TaxID=36930 RepID=UPI002ED5EE70